MRAMRYEQNQEPGIVDMAANEFSSSSSSSSSHERKRVVVLTTLRVVVGVVFIGWLFLWAMAPTDTYQDKWSMKIRSKTNSTYFGRQGTTILMFTFPILLISVLGCVYVHLKKKALGCTQRGFLNSHLKAVNKPLIVKGPLGIVKGLEFAFCLMFLALLIWCMSIYLRNYFLHIDEEAAGENTWEDNLEAVAEQLGFLGGICCAFLFFPVTRGSSLLPLIGLTSEASIKYHIWLGHIVMVLFTAHGLGFLVSWAGSGISSHDLYTHLITPMLSWHKVGISIMAGEIALLAGLVLWVTTYSSIRRKKFELFFYTHHLYIVFFLFFLLHLGISFFCYILPGIYLFMLDRFLRFLQSRQRVRLVSARILPSETIELNFSKSQGLKYTPMSSMFINIPSISSLQWHPFTVSSSSNLEPEKISVIIKKEGSWTEKLYRALSSPSLDRLDVSVEGPYGPASVDFLSYSSLVMVSGGSGITPFISIIRELIYLSNLGKPTPRVVLICAFKTSADLMMLDLLLPISSNVSDLRRLQLQVEAFVTRGETAVPNSQKRINMRWFNPIPSDMPLAPVLGPNGWLWLAAIISTSFISYLVLFGIMNRFFINPIETRTGSYPSSAKSLLHLLLICVCIAATASAAVLWNKRRACMEANQVQSTFAGTPNTSTNSCLCNIDDRELESMPHKSITQATNVHFGRRPDLKKMLLECKDPNTAVMVSGPAVMRREVAKLCSSGLADNLHFESISFSW